MTDARKSSFDGLKPGEKITFCWDGLQRILRGENRIDPGDAIMQWTGDGLGYSAVGLFDFTRSGLVGLINELLMLIGLQLEFEAAQNVDGSVNKGMMDYVQDKDTRNSEEIEADEDLEEAVRFVYVVQKA